MIRPSGTRKFSSHQNCSLLLALLGSYGVPVNTTRQTLFDLSELALFTPYNPPGQAPSWKSTGNDRYFLCGLGVKTGCSHTEIFGAQPLQISSMFRARIILGSFWARVHGRCGVPVVLHGPKSCWLENYCDHNVHVICKNVTENIPSIPLREPSCT